jgi:hypothetical protein
MQKVTTLMLAMVLTLSAGCGGGGDSGTSTPVPVPVPVPVDQTYQLRNGYLNLVTKSLSQVGTYSGTIQGLSITGTAFLTSGSLTGTTFEGIPALQKVTTIAGVLSGNGTNVPVSTSTTTYFSSDYAYKGSSGNEYTVVTTPVNIPETAKVNDIGIAYSENRYTSISKQTFLGKNQVAYALQPDTASTAILKIITTSADQSGAMVGLQVESYRMTPDGRVTELDLTYIDKNSNFTVSF